MHIEELHLKAFGPFTDLAITLAPGLNILYGPNEAGKSSMLRAIDALLFGVPSRTTDNFVHDYRQMRVGGVLVREDGEQLACVRRKGNKATLRDADDAEALDEGVMNRFLGAVDQEFFRSVFGIDHERLRDGGVEVVRGKGRIGELLFAAGGVAHLRAIQEKLDDDAALLFKARAKQPPINAATARLEQLRTEIREHQAPAEEWARYQAALAERKQAADELRQQLQNAEAARERLRRIDSAWPTLCAWKSCVDDLHADRDAALLSEDADQRRSEAQRQLSLAQSTIEQARQRIAHLNEQLEAIDVPETLLGQQRRIDDLYKRLGSHEKGAVDRATLEARRRTARNHAKKMLEKLGWSTPVDEVGQRRLTDADKTTIRRLATRHGQLAQRRQAAEQARLRTATRIEQLQQQLADTPSVDLPMRLTATLQAAAAASTVADGLDARQRAAAALAREADEQCARLPRFAGTLDEAVRLKAPPLEAVDQFADQQRCLEADLANLQQRRQEEASQQEQIREQLAALEKGDAVPTEEQLQQARRLRDATIRLAVEALQEQAIDPGKLSELVDQIDSARDLPTALEPAIRQADQVADRLRREADRVAEKTQLLARVATSSASEDRIAGQIETVRDNQRQLRDRWNALWQESGVKPGSPREMRAWLAQHAELLELAQELHTQKDNFAADQARCEAISNDLTQQLSECGMSTDGSERLSLLVERSQSYIDQLQRRRARRDQLEKELERAEQEAETAAAEYETADDHFSQWEEDWAAAMTPLGLPADANPEIAEQTLANVETLFQHLDQADGFRDRVWGIDKTAKEFTQAARDVAAATAPDLGDCQVDELVAELNRRTGEARRLQQQAETLITQRSEDETAVYEAEAAMRDAQAVLDSMMIEAGCEEIGELSQAIERSNRKRQRQQRLDELSRQLQPYCAGQSLEEFYADAASVDPDRMASELEAADALVEQLRSRFEEAVRDQQQAAADFTRYDGSAEAADKAIEREYLLSELQEDVQDYLVTRVAASLLQTAIQRYQQRYQGPVLALASDRFEQLTGDAFTGLRPDYDSAGQDVLVGIRQDDRSLVQVEEMSEGTRDQLYLALRLATLEHWLEDHEPVPLIADDILLSFDDARAEAALASLMDLSSRTQVLFFTHHDHLVSLAQKVSDARGGDVAIHTVNEATVPALG